MNYGAVVTIDRLHISDGLLPKLTPAIATAILGTCAHHSIAVAANTLLVAVIFVRCVDHVKILVGISRCLGVGWASQEGVIVDTARCIGCVFKSNCTVNRFDAGCVMKGGQKGDDRRCGHDALVDLHFLTAGCSVALICNLGVEVLVFYRAQLLFD